MLPAFQILQNSDRLFTKLQDNIKQVLSALQGVQIVQGALATYTVPNGVGLLTGATFSVNQSLGQAVTAVFPALLTNTYTNFLISKAINPAPTTTVLLTTTAALPAGLTLNFWVI